MLVSTLISDVQQNLNDQNAVFYTEQDCLDSLQDSCDQLIIRSGLIEKTIDINFQAGIGYYDLAALIPDYYAVTQIYNNAIRRWLVPEVTTTFDGVRDDWELWDGQPNYFAPVSDRRIVIVPRPTTNSGSMKVYYKAKSPTLTPSYNLTLPADIITVPEHYATADLLEQAREYPKASKMWKDANEGLAGAIKRSQLRALPALLYRLRSMEYGS